MRGYGDPNSGGLGYGSPSNSTLVFRDRGYGSPFDDISASLTLSSRRIHHRGGAEIKVTGELPTNQTYRISMNIDGVDVFLNSGIAGQGIDLYVYQGMLIGYSFPSRAGNFNMTLHHGALFGQQVQIGTIAVEPDNRGHERYVSKRLWPAHYKTGNRYSHTDPITNATIAPVSGVLETLTDIWGRLAQETAGFPATVVTQDYARLTTQIQIESSLGFSSSGDAFINGVQYSYTLNINTMTLTPSLRNNIPAGSEVQLYAP